MRPPSSKVRDSGAIEPGLAEDIDQHVGHQRGGDEVEHDRGDHDVAAALGLEIARHEGPEGSKCGARHHGKGGCDPPGHEAVERQADQRNAKARDIGLALAANVEQASVKSHRHSKAGKNKVGGVIEREAETFAVAECAEDHQFNGFQRVLADRDHHQTGDKERRCQVQQRNQPILDPAGKFTARQAHPLPPPFAASGR
jgi:hypothetical protein